MRTEVVEVTRDRYVRIPEELTIKSELGQLPKRHDFEAMSGKDKLITISVLYHFNTVRAQQCHGFLDEISRLGETP